MVLLLCLVSWLSCVLANGVKVKLVSEVEKNIRISIKEIKSWRLCQLTKKWNSGLMDTDEKCIQGVYDGQWVVEPVKALNWIT